MSVNSNKILTNTHSVASSHRSSFPSTTIQFHNNPTGSVYPSKMVCFSFLTGYRCWLTQNIYCMSVSARCFPQHRKQNTYTNLKNQVVQSTKLCSWLLQYKHTNTQTSGPMWPKHPARNYIQKKSLTRVKLDEIHTNWTIPSLNE